MFAETNFTRKAGRAESVTMLLRKVASNEIRTHYFYSILLRKHGALIESNPTFTHLLEEASKEDVSHYHAINECIFQKHGTLDFANPKDTIFGYSRQIKNSLVKLLKNLCLIEASSVQAYAELCALTLEYDYRIFDLSYRNMHENILHLELVNDALNLSALNEHLITET